MGAEPVRGETPASRGLTAGTHDQANAVDGSSGSASTTSGQRDVVLRRMTAADLPFVLDAHRAFFPDNLVGRLGAGFLDRYYQCFLSGEHAVATIAECDGEICGYLTGIVDVRRHRRLVMERYGRPMALLALRGLMLHPVLAVALVVRRSQTLARRAIRRGAGSEQADRVAVLSHIAVSADARGLGIGDAMIRDFLERAQAASAVRACLATRDGPGGAGPYYERRGWRLISARRTVDGRQIRLYEIDLGKGHHDT